MERRNTGVRQMEGLYGSETQGIYKTYPTNVHDQATDVTELSATAKRLIRKCYRESVILLTYEKGNRYLSLSTTRVRKRLFDLMGTDVIRLNDKRYFQKLSQRLQDEYETHMDKQEEARCAAEEQRIRRLMLDGIINKPTDYRAVVHSEHANKPAKKKKKRKSKKRMSDGFSTFTSEDINFGLPRHSEKEKNEKDLVTQVSIMSGARPGSSRPSYKPKRHSFASRQSSPRPSKGYSSEKENLELHVRPPHHETFRDSSPRSTRRKSRRVKSASSRLVHWEPEQHDYESGEDEEGFDSVSLPGPTQTRPPSKYSRHEPELIKTLRKEETVAGLYSLAEELISPVKAEDVVGNRKVIIKRAKKKMTVQY